MRFHARGYCTYCSAPKSDAPGDVPAVERYQSQRIRSLADAAGREGCPMWIVSGRYGLLAPSEPIPWYDTLLKDEDVSGLVTACVETLSASGVKALVYSTACVNLAPEVAPYLRLVRLACEGAGVALEVVTLPGVPV